MANERQTTFQRLNNVLIGSSTVGLNTKNVATYNVTNGSGSDIIARFDSKEERDLQLQQMKQQRYLSYQAKRVALDSSMEELIGASQVRIMYRDADLMDQWPDINSALHIFAEESTVLKDGKMINVYSKSPRIKAILEDLFYNRLDSNIMLPMIVRNTCKYGNQFMYLNLDMERGITGWRQLDVHQMRRNECGMDAMYGAAPMTNLYNVNPDDVKFIWEGHNETMPFQNFQVAHFRLIKDSMFLPYGASILNGARRHWRMLSMLEDAIFLHRLERSVERRIFKVNVGAIDENDVQAFLQDFANNFKRAPIVDPKTGQIDLRKNFLDVSADYFIPVRPGQDSTTIDTLPGIDYKEGMDDIDYFVNKILAMLRLPKTFLNYNEAQGKGQNLALIDIRFNRTVNAIQQAILMELNKIAIIHLHLLGFEDELTNFTLSMNNPSNQVELMELDNLTKRLAAASSALAEQGGGIPLMSWHAVQKEIMGKSDAEISDMLQEIRLESALANELQLTSQIIKKTGMFNKVDRIYGEPGAKYNPNAMNDNGGPMGGGGGFGGGSFGGNLGGGFGDDLGNLGEPGADEGGDLGGDTGSADLGDASAGPLMEDAFEKYKSAILQGEDNHIYRPVVMDKTLLINEDMNHAIQELEKITKKNNNILED